VKISGGDGNLLIDDYVYYRYEMQLDHDKTLVNYVDLIIDTRKLK